MTFPRRVCFNDDNFSDDSEEIPGVVNMDFELRVDIGSYLILI
jgi:hypothetical protein